MVCNYSSELLLIVIMQWILIIVITMKSEVCNYSDELLVIVIIMRNENKWLEGWIKQGTVYNARLKWCIMFVYGAMYFVKLETWYVNDN